MENPTVSVRADLLAIFWDIQNCGIPRGKAPIEIAKCVREKFIYAKEAEFLCVCDVQKEPTHVIAQLNDAQVTVVHVSSELKNSADEKLKQCMRKFCENHTAPVTLVLISGDVDFAAELSHMRYSHMYHIVLVHNKSSIKHALSATAHEIYTFDDLILNVPEKETDVLVEDSSNTEEINWLRITSLSSGGLSKLKAKISCLVNKTKGKLIHCSKTLAIAQYSQSSWAERGMQRIQGTELLGRRLMACHVSNVQKPILGMSSARRDGTTSGNSDHLAPPCSTDLSSRSFQIESQSKKTVSQSSPDESLFAEASESQTAEAAYSFNFSRTPGSKKNRSHQNPVSYTSTPAPTNKPPTYYIHADAQASHFNSLQNFYEQAQPQSVDPRYVSTPRSSRPFVYAECNPYPGYSADESRAIMGQGVFKLSVTNLDYNITSDEWRRLLLQTFMRHVDVLKVEILKQSNNECSAIVYVPSLDDARFAVQQFHKRKIGYKRIHVSLVVPGSPVDSNRIKYEVLSIMVETNQHVIPLFKFIELYEKRYRKPITVSELYTMRDIVEIKGHSSSGRLVYLQSNSVVNQMISNRYIQSDSQLQAELHHYCTVHCSQPEYTLLEETGMLPYVKLRLKDFIGQVNNILQLHNWEMPLLSFPNCYEATYSKVRTVNEGGVPLEHLISCVPNVQIKMDKFGYKKIVWSESCSPLHAQNDGSSSVSSEHFSGSGDMSMGRLYQGLSQQLSQFSREVVDLLKRMPACQMSFSKFIPAYHHHFGRQCRVADFGFTKLQELFEAIPHVLQILGTGNLRVLYLTHRIHLRRFTADLCRVLKAQTEKQCTIELFPERYSEVMGTDLVMSNFGVAYIEDMLLDIPETQVLIIGSGPQTIMKIPKKDQTEEEKEKTIQFSYEVIDLLKNCPHCSMAFNKFIPSYHHHYGRQCRVSEYGFSKLMELFEAIPDVVQISESGEERYIHLTKTEHLKVLAEQLLVLLKVCSPIDIKELGLAYQKLYGYNIYMEEFGVESLEELMKQLENIVTLEKPDGNVLVHLADKSGVEFLYRNCLGILLEKSNGIMSLPKFIEQYTSCYGSPDLVAIKHSLFPAIQMKADETCGSIYLHPLLMLARRVKLLLSNYQGKITVINFEATYRCTFGKEYKVLSFPSVPVLLRLMDFMVCIRGRGNRQTILLRPDYQSRLAHQLSYKIGIYADLLRYRDMEKIDKTKDTEQANPHLNYNDSGIGGDSYKIEEEEEEDYDGDETLENCSFLPDAHQQEYFGGVYKTPAEKPSQDLEHAREMLKMDQPFGNRLSCSEHPQMSMSLRMKHAQSVIPKIRRSHMAASIYPA